MSLWNSTSKVIPMSKNSPTSGELLVLMTSSLGHQAQWRSFFDVKDQLSTDVQKILLSRRPKNVYKKENQVIGSAQNNIPKSSNRQYPIDRQSKSPLQTRTCQKPRATQFTTRITQTIPKGMYASDLSIQQQIARAKSNTSTAQMKLRALDNLSQTTEDHRIEQVQVVEMMIQSNHDSSSQIEEEVQASLFEYRPSQTMAALDDRNSYQLQPQTQKQVQNPIDFQQYLNSTRSQYKYPGQFRSHDVVQSVLQADFNSVAIQWAPRLTGEVPALSWQFISEFKKYYPNCMLDRKCCSIPFDTFMEQIPKP